MLGEVGGLADPYKLEPPLRRNAGFAVFACLLLAAALLRWHESARADELLASEARTREVLSVLYDASIETTRQGVRHPGLRDEFLSGVAELEPMQELGSEQISYARDDAYMYGLATRTTADENSSAVLHGFILRAWPLDYGATGDFEYQLADDGDLWQGQNLVGRSGTDNGFPPRFPDPRVGNPDEPWWIVPLPGHR